MTMVRLYLFLVLMAASCFVQSASWIKNAFSDGNCCMNTQAEMILDSLGYPVSVVSFASNATVEKRHPDTGELIWTYAVGDLAADIASESQSIALDTNDDVIIAGALSHTDASTPSRGFVIKLDGATGQEVWRWLTPFGKNAIVVDQVFFDVLVDNGGHVYALGSRWNSITKRDLYAVRLDGNSGSLVWQYIEHGGNNNEPGNMWWERFVAAAFDGNGNLIAAGTLMQPFTQDWDIVLRRLDMATGIANWGFQYDEVAQESAMAMVLLSNGSAVVAAGGYSDGYLFRVTPGNSQPDWVYDQPYQSSYNWTYDLAVAANDDVFYGGELDTFGQVLGRVNGASGAGVWVQTINGGSYQQSAALAIAVGSDQHLYSVGYRYNQSKANRQMQLAKLDGTSGAIYWETLVPYADDNPNWSRLRDVQVDAAANYIFAVGTEGGHSSALNSLWARTLSVETNNGKLPLVLEWSDIYLIPIWDNWLLWLIPVDDIAQIERERTEIIAQGLRPGYQLTHSVNDLIRQPATAWYVIADGEGRLIKELASAAQQLSRRSAPVTLYVERDSPAFRLALELLKPEAYAPELDGQMRRDTKLR